MQIDNNLLRQQFAQAFGPGGRVRIIRAPGRVNLIGEHTDYNDGFVFPMAIEPEVRLACRAREDGKVRFSSTLFAGEVAEFSVDGDVARAAHGHWSNYPRGVAAMLKAAGIPMMGMDALLTNSLPGGGGLSSSAAIEVATAQGFLALAGYNMEPMRLALICQKAEHEYPKVPCGIMDQMIVTTAKIGHAMLFDCRAFMRKPIPMPPEELQVVIANTMVKHDLTGADGKTEYAKRREQCGMGVTYFKTIKPGIKSLRDVTPELVNGAQGKLDDVVFRRCRHVVGETQRCQDAAAALVAKDYNKVGELMKQSHESLRADFEVSCEELDFLSSEANKVAGVYGARMTGGGFGGCAIALARREAENALRAAVIQQYNGRFAKPALIYTTKAEQGATVQQI